MKDVYEFISYFLVEDYGNVGEVLIGSALVPQIIYWSNALWFLLLALWEIWGVDISIMASAGRFRSVKFFQRSVYIGNTSCTYGAQSSVLGHIRIQF